MACCQLRSCNYHYALWEMSTALSGSCQNALSNIHSSLTSHPAESTLSLPNLRMWGTPRRDHRSPLDVRANFGVFRICCLVPCSSFCRLPRVCPSPVECPIVLNARRTGAKTERTRVSWNLLMKAANMTSTVVAQGLQAPI